MFKLRYNDVKWSFPMTDRSNFLIKTLNAFTEEFDINRNPFESFYGDMIFPELFDENDILHFYEQSLFYKLQFIFLDEMFEFNFIENPKFRLFLSMLEKFDVSFVFSNEILFDFFKNNYNNFMLIASEDKITKEAGFTNETDYYEELKNRYDRVILNPEYVKKKFFNEYKNFSDVSKFEIFVDYYEKNDIYSGDTFNYFLTPDEIKFLVEVAGIKFFRFSQGNTNSLVKNFEKFFEYIFRFDAKSLYIFTEMLDKVIFEDIFYYD